jgi:hypothetical protein
LRTALPICLEVVDGEYVVSAAAADVIDKAEIVDYLVGRIKYASSSTGRTLYRSTHFWGRHHGRRQRDRHCAHPIDWN